MYCDKNLEHVGRMTENITILSDSIRTKDSSTVSRSVVVAIVQNEVAKSIKPTNELLLKMNGMFKRMSNSLLTGVRKFQNTGSEIHRLICILSSKILHLL